VLTKHYDTDDWAEKNPVVFWPCPGEDHPGTPRPFEDRTFNTAEKRAHFNAVEYCPPAEVTDEEYPVVLVDQYPEPLVEMHPTLAEKLGVRSGDMVNVETRRGKVTLKANVVETIREDTIFIPYHWADDKSANLLTVRALDPVSKSLEFDVCACKVPRAA
jgi:assimilatory nitrate reductase catalytic subunit